MLVTSDSQCVWHLPEGAAAGLLTDIFTSELVPEFAMKSHDCWRVSLAQLGIELQEIAVLAQVRSSG